MTNPGDELEVGVVLRAHGLKGDLLVDLWSDRTERLDPGTVLRTDRGEVHVLSAHPHQHRFLVRLAEVPDRETAETWRGVVLRAERLDLDEDVIWVDQLFGCRVVDQDEVERGRVVDVEANPASDLLVLDSGALVPLHFVTSLEPHSLVRVEVPEGLFE
ncbi:MAG: 16S rRNA processing protein RimM [Acidimicrobiaceae bacterium]|nr:16S rRNA processing protein RimM [Acidimicrobiaceae bacterium]